MSGIVRARIPLLVAIITALLTNVAPALAAGTGTISGTVFLDVNRDGVRQESEDILAGKRIYLFAADGSYLKNALTDSSGRYAFAGLSNADYRVQYGSADWWDLWAEWVPSTLESIRPKAEVSLLGAASVDFGWRRIVRSTDPAAPISMLRAPNGLTIKSYNDAVTAADIYDAYMQGALHGAEAGATTIHFDLNTGDYCVSSTVQVNGKYGQFSAGCNINFLRWLDSGDQIFFHEYGHTWADYHAFIVQQDPKLTRYLAARGIDPHDPRLGTSHAWSRFELLAEDFRQLFGSPNARLRAQENRDLPAAGDVPGLGGFLSTEFMRIPTPNDPPVDPPPASLLVVDDLAVSPDPVKQTGAVSYQLSTTASVTVTILNAKNSVIATLVGGKSMTGSQTVPWDRKDSNGRRVKAGSYRVEVDATNGSARSIVTQVFSVL